MEMERSVTPIPPQDRPVALLPLFVGFLGAPITWALHLMLSYFLLTLACAGLLPAPRVWLTIVTLAAVLAAVGAGVVAYRSSSPAGVREPSGVGAPWARARFLMRIGLYMSALFVLGIVLAGIPPLVLDPCGS